MTTTMQLIAKQTVGAGGAASVTFSNIPQTYTDLKVVISGRNVSGEHLLISFNGSTANFAGNYVNGYNGAVGAGSYARYLGNGESPSYTANAFGSAEVYIPNYKSANNKSLLSDTVAENNDASNYAIVTAANTWSSSSAITSITFNNENGTGYSQYSTFYLYGISNSITTQATTVPYASGGDVITTDGSYWYHAFKTSGSFTPLKNLTADVLVVGGGAGGWHGGGGAGGVFYATAQALTSATNYTCTIGAGGAANTTVGGGNSSFGALTVALAGGASNDVDSGNGQSGGSGGGAPGSGGGGPSRTGGSSTQTSTGGTGYGNAGGNTSSSYNNNQPAAGGGGAGSAGGTVTSASVSGNGGAGLNTWSSWLSATSTGVSGYIAGGGGGGHGVSGTRGTGGSGGGGNGANSSNAGSAGTANTGSGGGGKSFVTYTNGYAGGSGIIIVRYAV